MYSTAFKGQTWQYQQPGWFFWLPRLIQEELHQIIDEKDQKMSKVNVVMEKWDSLMTFQNFY